MKDLRPLPDEASEDESTSKLIFLDPGLGTDRLDAEEEDCSTTGASSSRWGCVSSCQGIKRGIISHSGLQAIVFIIRHVIVCKQV